MAVVFCCMDRLIPRPLLDVLVIPVEHSLIGWMLLGGVAEVCYDILRSSTQGPPLPSSP
jgi:hypothetical protein